MIDLDGTLLDTASDLAAAANMMLRELGRAELPLETIQSYIGKGIQKLVKRSLTGSLDGEPDAGIIRQERCRSMSAITRKRCALIRGLIQAYGGFERPAGKRVFVWPASPTRLRRLPCRCSAPLACSIILILSCQATACPKRNLIRCPCCMPVRISAFCPTKCC